MGFLLASLSLVVSQHALAASPEVLSFCRDEWKGDSDMISFCVEEREKAKVKLKSMDTTGTIGAPCKAKWGTDYPMVVFCIEEQEKARSELKRNDAPSNITAYCEGKWKTDFPMVKFCIDEQVKAKKELAGMNASRSVLDQCASRWKEDNTMILYCVKEAGGGSGTSAPSTSSGSTSSQSNVWPGAYMSAPIRKEVTLQMLYVFDKSFKISIFPRSGGSVMGVGIGSCSQTSGGFDCALIEKSSGEVLTTLSFSAASDGSYITQTANGLKLCRVSQEEGASFLAGKYVQGCR